MVQKQYKDIIECHYVFDLEELKNCMIEWLRSKGEDLSIGKNDGLDREYKIVIREDTSKQVILSCYYSRREDWKDVANKVRTVPFLEEE